MVKEAVTLDNAIFKARLTEAGKDECRRRQAAKDAQELVAKQNRAFDPADKRSRTSLTISKFALGLSAIAIGITLYKLWLERDSAQSGQGTSTVQSAPAPEKGLNPAIGDSAKADSAKDSISRR